MHLRLDHENSSEELNYRNEPTMKKNDQLKPQEINEYVCVSLCVLVCVYRRSSRSLPRSSSPLWGASGGPGGTAQAAPSLSERQQWRQDTEPLDTTAGSLNSVFLHSSLPPPSISCSINSSAFFFFCCRFTPQELLVVVLLL